MMPDRMSSSLIEYCTCVYGKWQGEEAGGFRNKTDNPKFQFEVDQQSKRKDIYLIYFNFRAIFIFIIVCRGFFSISVHFLLMQNFFLSISDFIYSMFSIYYRTVVFCDD